MFVSGEIYSVIVQQNKPSGGKVRPPWGRTQAKMLTGCGHFAAGDERFLKLNGWATDRHRRVEGAQTGFKNPCRKEERRPEGRR
jgi:hypothetical protein